MRDLLAHLCEIGRDTYIIIDSPPIMSASEPILLSKMVDGIILVVMAGQTPKESIKRATQSLDQGKIIGIVFNQKDVKSLNDYSKYYYRHNKIKK